MDVPELPKTLRLAGKHYYDQLRKLGLKPEGFLWVHDNAEEKFVLWLIWSGVDRFGPLAITELLFQAYRASALTQEIDPFLVNVRSPLDSLGKAAIDMTKSHPNEGQVQFRINEPGSRGPDEGVRYQWDRRWAYHLEKKRKPTLVVNRDWRRFSENVSKLAA